MFVVFHNLKVYLVSHQKILNLTNLLYLFKTKVKNVSNFCSTNFFGSKLTGSEIIRGHLTLSFRKINIAQFIFKKQSALPVFSF